MPTYVGTVSKACVRARAATLIGNARTAHNCGKLYGYTMIEIGLLCDAVTPDQAVFMMREQEHAQQDALLHDVSSLLHSDNHKVPPFPLH